MNIVVMLTYWLESRMMKAEEYATGEAAVTGCSWNSEDYTGRY